jgi:hypothetical protein
MKEKGDKSKRARLSKKLVMPDYYGIVKDSNADLTVGN